MACFVESSSFSFSTGSTSLLYKNKWANPAKYGVLQSGQHSGQERGEQDCLRPPFKGNRGDYPVSWNKVEHEPDSGSSTADVSPITTPRLPGNSSERSARNKVQLLLRIAFYEIPTNHRDRRVSIQLALLDYNYGLGVARPIWSTHTSYIYNFAHLSATGPRPKQEKVIPTYSLTHFKLSG